MIALAEVPNGWDECVGYYGNPISDLGTYDPTYAARRVRTYAAPFPLRESWVRPGRKEPLAYASFRAHFLVGPAIADALAEILAHYGLEEIRAKGLDEWGGDFNPRQKRPPAVGWSVHTFGCAIDYLPSLGPLGEPPRIPPTVLHAFMSRGFEWGGSWTRPDGQHWQACHGL